MRWGCCSRWYAIFPGRPRRCGVGSGTASGSRGRSSAARRSASSGWAGSAGPGGRAARGFGAGGLAPTPHPLPARAARPPHAGASTGEAQEGVSLEILTAGRDGLLTGDLSFAINVPGISGDLLRRLGPLLDLARRLGRLGLALVEGPVRSIEVAYGGKDEAAPRPVLVAAVDGLLSALGAVPVRLVTALLLADGRRDQNRRLPPGTPRADGGRGARGRERRSGADQRGARGAAAGTGRAAGEAGVSRGLGSRSDRPVTGDASSLAVRRPGPYCCFDKSSKPGTPSSMTDLVARLEAARQ